LKNQKLKSKTEISVELRKIEAIIWHTFFYVQFFCWPLFCLNKSRWKRLYMQDIAKIGKKRTVSWSKNEPSRKTDQLDSNDPNISTLSEVNTYNANRRSTVQWNRNVPHSLMKRREWTRCGRFSVFSISITRCLQFHRHWWRRIARLNQWGVASLFSKIVQ